MSQSFLEIRHVVKNFGETSVLKDINLSVNEKEIVVLLGPSGCGKTTLLRIIAGLIDCNEGEVFLEGEDLLKKPVNERGIGFVFQKYALFPNMNVEDNILFGLKLRKVKNDEMKARLEEVLELVELTGLNKRRINELSGGQQQRVALARALIIKPKIMLLDEPLSNLDAKLRASVRVNIVRILKKLGITAIVVTHDQTEAMTMGDRVVIMNKGVIQQDDEPKVIYNNPSNLFVAGFLGTPEINLVDVRIENGKVLIGKEEVAVPDFKSYFSDAMVPGEGIYTMGIRPEFLEPSSSGFSGVVTMCENCGSDTYLHVDVFGIDCVVKIESALCSYRPDDRVKLNLKKGFSYLFDREGNRIL